MNCNTIYVFAAEGEQTVSMTKVYSDVSIEEDFDGSSIIVIIDNSLSGINKRHDVNFFEGIEIVEIEDLTVKTESARSLVDKKTFEQVLKIKLPQDCKESVIRGIKQLESINGIKYAGPNRYIEVERNPNDPFFTHVSGGEANQWGLNRIQANLAWDLTTGNNNVRVGIIDTGIGDIVGGQANHPDLNANLVAGGDFVNMNGTTPGPLRADTDGHGTHVAGIVGGVGNNSVGISGVNWNVSLVPMQVATGDTIDAAACVRAINFATNTWNNENRISILSMSIGRYTEWPEIETAIRAYPGLFVCSTGNRKQNNDITHHYPSFYGSALHTNPLTNMISVGRSDINDERPTDLNINANWGAQTITLFAPGQNIISTYPVSVTSNWTPGYHRTSGSSMAAPMVSGVAALLLSVNANLTTTQLRAAIVNNVDVLDTFENDPTNGRQCVTGGRLNAYKALSSVIFTTSNVSNGISINGFINGYTMPNNTELVLPDSFAPLGDEEQQPVVEIGNNAFANQTSLTEISIPSSITSIGANAFAGCTSLNSVIREFNYDITTTNCYYLIRENLNNNFLEVNGETVSNTNDIVPLYLSAGNHSIKVQGSNISSVMSAPTLEKVEQIFLNSNQDVKSSIESGKNIFHFNNFGGRFVRFTIEATSSNPNNPTISYLENAIIVRDSNGVIKKFENSIFSIEARNVTDSNTITVYLPTTKTYYVEVNFSTTDISELTLTARLLDNASQFNLFNLNENANSNINLFNIGTSNGDEIKVINILQSGQFKFVVNCDNRTTSSKFVIIKEKLVDNQIVRQVINVWNMDMDENGNGEIVDLEPAKYYMGYFNTPVGVDVTILINRLVTQSGSDVLVTDPDYMTPCGSQINIIEADKNIKSYRQTFITEGFTRLVYFDIDYAPSISRLDYYWYSSNSSVATVTPYGTVLALPVTTATTVKIMAVFKTDCSKVFIKEFTILDDIGLSCEYDNREEMVNDFLDDYTAFYNAANNTSLSRVTLLIPGDSGYDASTALVARLDNQNATLELFYNNLDLYNKWIWIVDYTMEIRPSSQTEFQKYINNTATGTSTIVKYEIWAFLSKRVKTTWPQTSDYTIDENANGFWSLINGESITIDINVTIPAGQTVMIPLIDAEVPINILQYYLWSTENPESVTFADWGKVYISSSAIGQTVVLNGSYILNPRVVVKITVQVE